MQKLFRTAFMSCRFLLMFGILAIFGCSDFVTITYVDPELCKRNIVSVGERVAELQNSFMHSTRLFLYQGMENSKTIKLSVDFVQNRTSYHEEHIIDTDNLNKGKGVWGWDD